MPNADEPNAPSTPTSPPPARADETLRRRLARFGVSGRRNLRRRWSRERAGEIGRNLIYVVPLTLLIWVWAQDQQIETAAQENVSVEIVHTDAQKIVELLESESGEALARRADGSILATMTLQGPRVGLNQVLRTLRDEAPTSPLRVELRGGPADRTAVSLRERLADVPLLREAGVGVVEVVPSDVAVRVEEKVQVPATVVRGGDLAESEIDGPVTFDPPTVTLEGPKSFVERLRDRDGSARVIAELPADATPGEQTVSVSLELPPEAGERTRERVTMGRAEVKATFARRQRRRVELRLDAVVLTVSKPIALEDHVVTGQNTISGLVVEGPAEAIDRLRADQSELRATVDIGRYDPARPQPIRLVPRLNLPEGVTLKGEVPPVAVEVVAR